MACAAPAIIGRVDEGEKLPPWRAAFPARSRLRSYDSDYGHMPMKGYEQLRAAPHHPLTCHL